MVPPFDRRSFGDLIAAKSVSIEQQIKTVLRVNPQEAPAVLVKLASVAEQAGA
jgi:hypothetical protein